MLCSRCSEPVRPVVALDVDETLAKYLKHWFKFANSYFDKMWFVSDYDGRFSLSEFMGISKEQYRTAKLAYRAGGWKRNMPIYDGAQMLWAKLRAVDAEIWVTTTRPYMRMDNIDPDTREWLRRYGLDGYRGLLYDEDKYAELLERVDAHRIVGIVEDDPAQCARAADLGLAPIRPRRRQNDHAEDPLGIVVPSLHVAQKVLLERIDHWKEEHGTA